MYITKSIIFGSLQLTDYLNDTSLFDAIKLIRDSSCNNISGGDIVIDK